MTSKSLVKTKGKHSVIVTATKGQNYDDAVAAKLTQPEVQASLTIQKLHPVNDVNALTKILSQQTADVIGGDMSRAESMLLSQAHTLDALFNSLVLKGLDQTHMPNYQAFMALAFRAQGQCKATLQALSDIKNPSVIYAKQANVSGGHQQINNNVVASSSRKQSSKQKSSELLEHTHGERVDSRKTIEAIPVNSRLEALAT
jgi:hypothetical protein